MNQKTDRVKSAPRLERHASRTRIDLASLDDRDGRSVQKRLLRATLDRSDESVADVVAGALVSDMPADHLLGSLVPEVAAELGRKWLDDELSFLDVTIASSKLHRAIHEIRNASRPAGSGPAPRVLFTTVPGEQHALGAAVAEQMAWQVGVDTRLDVRGNRDIDDTAAVGFDAVAIAVPCDRTLERLDEMVRRLRAGAEDRSCGIFLGGGLATASLARRVGADGCAHGVDELLQRLA